MKQRRLYGVIAVGGVIGLIASFLETIEYQTLLKNAHANLSCNLNSVFSCSNVLNAWQSKIFGFPNSMLCILMFTMMLTVALVGLSSDQIARTLRLWLQGLVLFFLAFGTWFMWESAYRIHALCILCAFCLTGLLLLNWAWLRLNAHDLPISSYRRKQLDHIIEHGTDTFVWALYAILLSAVLFIHFHK